MQDEAITVTITGGDDERRQFLKEWLDANIPVSHRKPYTSKVMSFRNIKFATAPVDTVTVQS